MKYVIRVYYILLTDDRYIQVIKIFKKFAAQQMFLLGPLTAAEKNVNLYLTVFFYMNQSHATGYMMYSTCNWEYMHFQ